MSPFEIKGINKKFNNNQKPGIGESFVDLEDAKTLEDDRETIDYRMLSVVLFSVFAILLGRLYFLQAVKGNEYRDLAEGNKLRVRYVLAPRGLVLDKYGQTIAGNVPSFELVAIPNDLPESESELDHKTGLIAQILGIDKSELLGNVKKIERNSYQAMTLVENLPKDQALVLIEKQNEFKGFAVENNPRREYKDPVIFSHLVGYTGKITSDELKSRPDSEYLSNDYIGKTGLEYQYEHFMRGVAGKKQMEIDATGNIKKTLAEVPAQPGNNIKLNIDYELQKIIYDSLKETMNRLGVRRAAAVATEPQTGKVLAYISLPGFDNNWFARGINKTEYDSLLNDSNIPLLNRVVSGTYPPGSTVKPMLGLAALTEGVVKPDTKILDDGVIRVGEFTYYGYERAGLGLMDIYSAIARSSDIYFYTIGGGRAGTGIKGMGADKLAEWYRKFNLGSKLNIDMPSEKTGLVPDTEWKQRVKKEPWYLGNTYHYSIGQGDLLVTPLQVNSWTATLANGGKIMQPIILDEVVSRTGEIIYKTEPKILNENFLDQGNVRIVQEAMRQTVTAGSARSLNTLPIEIAGKTGTAQFDAQDLNRTHAWFTSYAPFSDPKIALTILVESGGEGSSVAVPISKKVYEWWAQNRSGR